MIRALSELEDSVRKLREAVVQRDMHLVRVRTQTISELVFALSKHSPGELDDNDREVVKQLMVMTSGTNQLLELQMDFCRLALEDTHQQQQLSHHWYA
jgi:hypothetical protein